MECCAQEIQCCAVRWTLRLQSDMDQDFVTELAVFHVMSQRQLLLQLVGEYSTTSTSQVTASYSHLNLSYAYTAIFPIYPTTADARRR